MKKNNIIKFPTAKARKRKNRSDYGEYDFPYESNEFDLRDGNRKSLLHFTGVMVMLLTLGLSLMYIVSLITPQ